MEATYIKIVWRKPQQPNGIITQYRVKVHVQEKEVTLENIILIGKNKVFSFFLILFFFFIGLYLVSLPCLVGTVCEISRFR